MYNAFIFKYNYIAFIVKCSAYFHHEFIHSPMHACPHYVIQVVSNLSCAPDHVLPILASKIGSFHRVSW